MRGTRASEEQHARPAKAGRENHERDRPLRYCLSLSFCWERAGQGRAPNYLVPLASSPLRGAAWTALVLSRQPHGGGGHLDPASITTGQSRGRAVELLKNIVNLAWACQNGLTNVTFSSSAARVSSSATSEVIMSSNSLISSFSSDGGTLSATETRPTCSRRHRRNEYKGPISSSAFLTGRWPTYLHHCRLPP